MKIGFTGDVYLGNITAYTKNPFQEIIQPLKEINLVINLESPIVLNNNSLKPIKNKKCLNQNPEEFRMIKPLNPFLINLSNNHINDYGNQGVQETKKEIENNKILYFGVGQSNEQHNVYVFEKQKIAFFSYTCRESDLSGSPLFNDKDFQGPKEFSIDLFKRQIKPYNNYTKVVLMHWGLEHINYPLPSQRKIARDMIDSGADLIIGNHAHVIQGYEVYKEKYIFYALGNFIFPHVKRTLRSSSYQEKQNRESIVPVFDITNKTLQLINIYYFRANKSFELSLSDRNNFPKRINHSLSKYESFYRREQLKFLFFRKIKKPLRIINKLRLQIYEK